MNLYEKCKKCGSKHPSVYKGAVCLSCREETLAPNLQRLLSNLKEVANVKGSKN